MEINEAFTLLELDENATREDIKRAYRRLSQACHPDKEGEQGKQSRLNEAFEVASQYAVSPKALTVRDMAALERLIDQAVVSTRRRSEAVRSAEQAVRSHKVSPLEQARLAAGAAAVTSGLFAALMTQVPELGAALPTVTAVVAIFLGGAAVLLNAHISLMDQRIRALSAELRVEDFLVNFLREIRIHIAFDGFDGDSFRRGLSSWIEAQGSRGSVVPSEVTRMVRSLDLEDAARLIIAIALEMDVLSTSIVDDGTTRTTRYSIRGG